MSSEDPTELDLHYKYVHESEGKVNLLAGVTTEFLVVCVFF